MQKPRLQEVPVCSCEPEGLAAKAAPGKTSRTVYAVTGIALYLFSSILKFVNDCHTEQSVTDAQLHKHHVTGHANLNWKFKWEMCRVLWLMNSESFVSSLMIHGDCFCCRDSACWLTLNCTLRVRRRLHKCVTADTDQTPTSM